MHTNQKVILSSILAAVLLSVPLWAKHQEKTAADADAKVVASKIPEMDKLKFYVGEWDYTETYPKSKFSPTGGQNTGVYKSRLGPGGNSLINEFHSQGPVGDFEGLLVMTWEPKEKNYKAYVFGNSFPGAVVETGTFENEALHYRYEFSMGQKKVALHNVTRITGPGKLVSEEYSSADGAPEVLLVTVEATKRK